MKVCVISDLHLGDGTAKDDFYADTELLGLCRRIDREDDGFLLILGDWIEGLQCTWYEIYRAHKTVIDVILELSHKDKAIVIKGNHDPDNLSELLGIPVYDAYIVKDILFMHGHQFDIFNSRYKFIGNAVAKIGGVLEKVIHRDLDAWFSNLADKLRGVGRYSQSTFYEEKALDLIHKVRGINKLVIGHTHKYYEIYIPGDNAYCNTGTWTGDRRDVLRINI